MEIERAWQELKARTTPCEAPQKMLRTRFNLNAKDQAQPKEQNQLSKT
jgi:hypothetical protein